jgi:ABC-type multidrug transport system fused ATPase/permease subunit
MSNSGLRRLLRELLFTRPLSRLLMLAVAALGTSFGLLGPLLQKNFLDDLSGSTEAFFAWPAVPSLLGAFVCTLLALVCNQVVVYIGARESLFLQRKWSQRIYEKVLSLRPDSWGGRQVGEIVSIYTQDLPSATILLEQSIPQALSILFPLLFAPWVLYKYFGIPLSRILIVLSLVLILNLGLALRQSRFFYLFKSLAADRVGLVNEWIQNIRTLRALGWVDFFEKRIFKVRVVETKNRVAMLNNGQTMNGLASSITFILNLSLIAEVVYSSTAKLLPGTLLALLWIVGVFLTRPFRQMPWFFTFLFDGTSSLRRTADLLALRNRDIMARQQEFLKLKEDTSAPLLQITNLNLKIRDSEILKDVSFAIQEGEFIGVVGEVGSGKSLLLMSLLGETGASFGTYKLKGQEARVMPLKQLHQYFTYVPQEGFVMSATLRENVAFDYETKTSEDHKILRALNNAQFALTQERLAQGLNTEIGERGVNLSGGQRQRVNLARIDYHLAPILLLDDVLSAVDVDTEKRIVQHLLLSEWKETTRILVTHRLSVLNFVDRILYFHEGELLGVGTLSELMERLPEFRQFTSSLREDPV